MTEQSATDTQDPGRFTEQETNGDGPPMDAIVAALKTVYDPEIPVDIYELGLIYDVKVENGHAHTQMTLTAPGCPVAEIMPGMVEQALLTVDGIDTASAEVVWEPPWDPSKMSEAARLELGMD